MTYIESLKLIGQGIKGLFLAFVNTVSHHRLLTLLILSVLANILLLLSFMQERVEVNNACHDLAVLQMQLDSATHANIKFYNR